MQRHGLEHLVSPVKSKDRHTFGSPELTGHDGKPVEVAEALAVRLRRRAMALDPGTGIYVFDDQPELDKLKGWYDQMRQEVEKPTDAELMDQQGRKDEDPPKRRAS